MAGTVEDRLRLLDVASSANVLDPFLTIDWDDPDRAIDDADPRWATIAEMVDPLAATPWWADQDARTRARYGMAKLAVGSMLAIELEGSLQIGLARFVRNLPVDSLEARYVCHEIAEEARHIQMFQELVLRLRAACPELSLPPTVAGTLMPDETLRYHDREPPEVLMMTALTVEEPVQQIQRTFLRLPVETRPPLLTDVFRLHTMDEARHIGYARLMLRERLADLPTRDVNRVRYIAPGALLTVSHAFVATPETLWEPFGIPRAVLESDEYVRALQRLTAFTASSCVAFAEKAGVMTDRLRPLWSIVL
jgi:hypothetical protein